MFEFASQTIAIIKNEEKLVGAPHIHITTMTWYCRGFGEVRHQSFSDVRNPGQLQFQSASVTEPEGSPCLSALGIPQSPQQRPEENSDVRPQGSGVAVPVAPPSPPAVLPASFVTLVRSSVSPVHTLHEAAGDLSGCQFYGGYIVFAKERLPVPPFVGNEFFRFRIWDATADAEVKCSSEVSNYFSALDVAFSIGFSKNGRYLACIDGDDLQIWQLTGSKAELRKTASLKKARMSAPEPLGLLGWCDSSVFVTGAWGGFRISQYSATGDSGDEPTILFDLNYPSQSLRSKCVYFSPVTRRVYFASEYPWEIGVLRPGSKKPSTVFRFPPQFRGHPCRFIPHPDPNLVALTYSNNEEMVLGVCNVKSGRMISEIHTGYAREDGRDGPRIEGFSPDGHYVVGWEMEHSDTSNGQRLTTTISVWDVSSRHAVRHTLNGKLLGVRFLPDGSGLLAAVTASPNATARRTLDHEYWQVIQFGLAADQIVCSFTFQGQMRDSVFDVSPGGTLFTLGGRIWSLAGLKEIEAHSVRAIGCLIRRTGPRHANTLLLSCSTQWHRQWDVMTLANCGAGVSIAIWQKTKRAIPSN